jgi:hypothetical protein
MSGQLILHWRPRAGFGLSVGPVPDLCGGPADRKDLDGVPAWPRPAACRRGGGLVPRHGRSVRRQWASFIAGWLGFSAVLAGLAAVEVVRIAEARATVADGWGAGLAAGAGGGLALSALLAVTVLVQLRRQRSWRGAWPMLVLAVTMALLLAVAVLTSTPPRPIGPNPAPYVVTSGAGVAEIAYVSTCLAQMAVMPAVLIPMAQIRRRRRSHQRGVT